MLFLFSCTTPSLEENKASDLSGALTIVESGIPKLRRESSMVAFYGCQVSPPSRALDKRPVTPAIKKPFIPTLVLPLMPLIDSPPTYTRRSSATSSKNNDPLMIIGTKCQLSVREGLPHPKRARSELSKSRLGGLFL